MAFVDPRLAALGVRCILPRADIRCALEGTGLAEAGFPAYDRLRLELGVPDGSRDLVPEKSILLESGFDELNGVDWQKGCYIGQELTARTKYRGLIKKRLMPVEIDGPAPAPGTIVTADGREVGEMRSSRDGLGLALLRLEPVVEGKHSEGREYDPRPFKAELDASHRQLLRRNSNPLARGCGSRHQAVASPPSPANTACAAARRAIGTR